MGGFVIILLYGGGIAAAGFVLLLATMIPRERPGRLLLSFFAILALVAQGGCWHVAGGIGKATGAGDDKMFPGVLATSCVIAAIWILWLLVPSGRTTNANPKEALKEDLKSDD